MSYSDDAVRAKLTGLNETSDSIVSNAQWIMFHKRYAVRTAELWLQRLKETSTNKRLNLLYLANEIIQQSLLRKKADFQVAFEPKVVEGTTEAYRTGNREVQEKVRKVVGVWEDRKIFSPEVLAETYRRLDELDGKRGGRSNGGAGGGGGARLGGSLFGGGAGGSSVPTELQAVAKDLAFLKKAEADQKPKVNAADESYAKMTDPNIPVPTPPVHAHQLSSLIKSLAAAQGAVDESIRARRELITGMEKLVESNRAKLMEDEFTAARLAGKKEGVDMKKKEVEDHIMRGLSNPASPGIPTPTSALNGKEIEPPEAEGFTPPAPDIETFTPPARQDSETTFTGDPSPLIGEESAMESTFTSTTGAETLQEQPPQLTEPPPAFEPPPALPVQDPAAAANAFLASLNVTQGMVRQASTDIPNGGSPTSGDPRLKRRKMSHKSSTADVDEEGFGLAGMDGVDEDGVSAALGV